MVFVEMLDHAEKTDNPQIKRFSWLLEAFFTEAVAEMKKPGADQTAQKWFMELSGLLEWIANGDGTQMPTIHFPGDQKALISGTVQ